MSAMNVVRNLALAGCGVATFLSASSPAQAKLFGHRGGGGGCCSSGGGTYTPPPPQNPPPPPEPMRQVRAIYFSSQFDAWFEVDALVPPAGASIGLSTIINVPEVGQTRAWIVSVYRQPRMTSPYKTETTDAERTDGAEGGAASGGPAASIRSSNVPAGLVRLWKSKTGKRQHYLELLAIENEVAQMKDASGTIFDVKLDSLCEADVAFLRGLARDLAAADRDNSEPVARLASIQE